MHWCFYIIVWGLVCIGLILWAMAGYAEFKLRQIRCSMGTFGVVDWRVIEKELRECIRDLRKGVIETPIDCVLCMDAVIHNHTGSDFECTMSDRELYLMCEKYPKYFVV